MRVAFAFRVAIVVCLLSPLAHAGVYGRLGGGAASPVKPADCSQLTATGQAIPAWSRLQWSLGVGSSSRHHDGAWDNVFALVPQASYALWARDARCAPGSGGLSPTHAWLRWSVGASADVVWRTSGADAIELRPALRLARSRHASDILSVGTPWVPSLDLALAMGPTFDPAWSGGAVSLGGRLSIISLEVRIAARTAGRGQEVVLLIGLTDLHGLWQVGPPRT